MEENTVGTNEIMGRDDAAYATQSLHGGKNFGHSGADFGHSADGVGRIDGASGSFGPNGPGPNGPGGFFGAGRPDDSIRPGDSGGSLGPDGPSGSGGVDGVGFADSADPSTPSSDDAIDGAAARQTKSAPGWIKRRIEEGVRRETAALERRLREEYEEKLRPLREAAMDAQADQLVRQGEFRSRERALEYLRLKSGQTAPQADDAVRMRAQALFSQAKAIGELGGVDVLGLYQNDPEIRRRVLSGEWDFMDVFRSAGGRPMGSRTPPAPVRSANGGAGGTPDVRRMSASELQRMNEALMRGETFDLRQ